ncbi:unnamed protein product [Ixodes persulcatus]
MWHHNTALCIYWRKAWPSQQKGYLNTSLCSSKKSTGLPVWPENHEQSCSLWFFFFEVVLGGTEDTMLVEETGCHGMVGNFPSCVWDSGILSRNII